MRWPAEPFSLRSDNAAVPAAVTCPFCQSTDWETLPDKIVLREDNPKKIRGGFPAVGYVCRGCNFIRLQLPDENDADR